MRFLPVVIVLSGVVSGISSLPTQVQGNGVNRRLGKGVDDNRREARNVRYITLNDPLDCLSQIICGLNTYPPQKPSVRTSTANDFAYLLKTSIGKLRRQEIPTTTTTTTVAPSTTKKSTPPPKALDDDDDDDGDDDDGSNEDELENDVDHEADDYSEYEEGAKMRRHQQRRQKRSSVFRKRKGNAKNKKNNKSRSKTTEKVSDQEIRKFAKIQLEKLKPPVTPLDRLRMEKDLRAKLLSDAKCVNGLVDHACPFNYNQMLSLISTSLERERTISYTTSVVLPLVGYLTKSRNLTSVLGATFRAIERIDNYTIEADQDGKPVDFSHVLDDVMNRNTGDNGLRIVDTSNDSGSTSVWEDDEFDHVLQNPYVRRKPSSENYKLAKKKKPVIQATKATSNSASSILAAGGNEEEDAVDDGDSVTEEDTSEEGLIFDRPKPPSSNHGPPHSEEDQSSSEEDDKQEEVFEEDESTSKRKKGSSDKGSLVAPPVFGHIRKNADDE